MLLNVTYMQIFKRLFARLSELLWTSFADKYPRILNIYYCISTKCIETHTSYCPVHGVSPLMIYAIQKRLALLDKNNFELNSLPAGVPFRVESAVTIVKYARW